MHHRSRKSRVNERIMEYYMKFGRGRDLERFMRLDSPSSSCSDDMGMRELFKEVALLHHLSTTSLPNIASDEKGHVINIPIRVEGRDMSASVSAEQLETPTKMQDPQLLTKTKETQTPESIGKSHKRLEWDSLGDIGYEMSMSSSNISNLERSLLRELFQETASTSASSSNNRVIVTSMSKGDQQRLQAEIEREPKPLNTPPLASSTFVDNRSRRPTGTLSKTTAPIHTHSQGTSMTPHKYYEQYVQTSMQRLPQLATREVQVNLSSTSTSIMGSTVTPSSFESYSSKSSHSATAAAMSGEFKRASRRRESTAAAKQQQENLFVAGISELLSRRQALDADKHRNCENRTSEQQARLRSRENAPLAELQESLQLAFEGNKENSNDIMLDSPQLDLGIRLLCSLIDVKSLTNRRKKQLVREIVKRISNTSVSNGGSVARSSSSAVLPHQPAAEPLDMRSLDEALPTKQQPEEPAKIAATRQPSPPETSANALAKLAARNALTAKSKATQSQQATTDASIQTRANKDSAKMVTANTQTSATSWTRIKTISARTSSSSKDEPTTQKAANDFIADNTDTEQATMREWLNPMTQSEMEYEESKRELIAETQRASNRRMRNEDTEREVQLTWIDGEIERLESLRVLLQKENSTIKSKSKSSTAKTQQPKNVEKIYDSVLEISLPLPNGANAERFSQEIGTKGEKRKSSTAKSQPKNVEKIYDSVSEMSSSMPSRASAERQIEVIIEESNENVVNLDRKLKRTMDRKREMQALYDKPTDGTGPPQGKARLRSVKETIVTRVDQVLGATTSEQPEISAKSRSRAPQRSKIDTPPDSNESESVGSFVQHRKREFLDEYTNKRQSHNEAMLKDQHRYERQRDRHNRPARDTAHSITNRVPSSPPPPPPPPPPSHLDTRTHVVHASSAGLIGSTSGQPLQQPHRSVSSMFYISSEMSIPMGSTGSSSIPTTTHQYDDVAAVAGADDVAVQTTSSLLHPQPISGDGNGHQIEPHVGQAAVGVQVKPKGIAYVVLFDNTPTTSSASIPRSTPRQEDTLTLQEHLARARPQFLEHSKERKAILNQLHSLRQEREREMRAIVDNTSLRSLDRNLRRLPPPPTKQLRIFPTRDMKAITKKRVANLPEVLQRGERERVEKYRLGNRNLRDVFNRRLQRRVRNGKLSLNHSRTVI